MLLKILQLQDFKRTVQIMNTEEYNNRQGKLNTPTQEAELVVELNSDIMKEYKVFKQTCRV